MIKLYALFTILKYSRITRLIMTWIFKIFCILVQFDWEEQQRVNNGLCTSTTGWTAGDWTWPSRKRAHTTCIGELYHPLFVTYFAVRMGWLGINIQWFASYYQHPGRKEERCFVSYKPLAEDGSPAVVDEFLEHAKFIIDDLEWLLALPHDKFWCQVRICWYVNSPLSRNSFSNHSDKAAEKMQTHQYNVSSVTAARIWKCSFPPISALACLLH